MNVQRPCCASRTRVLLSLLQFLGLAAVLSSVSTAAHAQTQFYPAYGLYNGNLNQMVVLECESQNDVPVSMNLEIFSGEGGFLTNLPFAIAAKGSQHVILNSLTDIRDRFGLYRLSILGGNVALGDKIHCRSSFYRPASTGASKQFEYFYAIPVRNPQLGQLSGIYNSFAADGAAAVTYNWLSVFNFGTTPLSATVEVFDQAGALARTVRIASLASRARIDIDLGHGRGQVTGLYRIVPDDRRQAYDALVIRYYPRQGTFRFAFPLRAQPGSCSGEPLLASTMGNGLTDNWLEIGNANAFDMPATIEVKDRFGQLLHSERQSVPSFGQYHVYLSSLIDPARTGNVGSVTVRCDYPTDKLIVQSAFYGRVPGSGEIEWAYSSQALNTTAAGATADLIFPLNTFVGLANWAKVVDSSGATQSLELTVFDQLGSLVAAGSNSLLANGTSDIGVHEMLGAERVGTMVLKGVADFRGEILRVLPRRDGQIGSILALPALVQQRGHAGVDGVGFRGDPQSLSPYREQLTLDEASHFVQRTSFGGNRATAAFVQQQGLSAAVASAVTLSDSSAVDLAASYWLDGDSDEDLTAATTWEGVRRWWIYHLRYTPNPFRERMALILHDLFALSCRDINSNIAQRRACFNHVQLLREEAFGNFRRLLKSMTKDYAMLKWLNNDLNTKSNPQENYSREHWELFSMGEAIKEGGRYLRYTDDDVFEAARAFTGWRTRIVSNEPVSEFDATRHDTGIKTLWEGTPYEVSGAFNWEDVTDLTLDIRPEAAQFIARRMFVALVHDHPSEQTIEQLASILRQNNFELLPVIRTILQSEAFFSSDARYSRIKDPITFLIGFLRKTDLHFRIDRLENSICDMGLCPTDPPDVNGWPGNKFREANQTDYFLAWAPQYTNAVTEVFRRMNDFQDPGTGANPNDLFLRLPHPSASGEELLQHLMAMLDVPLDQDEYQTLVNYTNTIWNFADEEQEREFDPLSANHVREKVSGLLWILSQHSNYVTY